MTDVRVFGERVAGAIYVQRPSAYAIIGNAANEVAIVRTRNGWFLPGGGIEAGETAEQATLREVLEECGFTVQLVARLPAAVQLVYSHTELTYFEKASVFFVGAVETRASQMPEFDHEVHWLPPAVATARMSHESHAWALREYESSKS